MSGRLFRMDESGHGRCGDGVCDRRFSFGDYPCFDRTRARPYRFCKGAGYARWAKVFNLKQMAKAMMFMEEHGIKSYAEMKEKADGISEKCDALLESVKADEARMSEVSVLRKHLINYAKTKDVFAAYKASGYNREFYEAHRDMLALRSAAKKAFDDYKKENGSDKKLPRISELNAEYAMLLERKRSSYTEYRKTKSEMCKIMYIASVTLCVEDI